ncbi:MAG: NADH:ubiquinone reductase (Na(+)-transporting) subunit A [Planctomycetes bacterium RBG_16_64_10]|nr:MAG: NADH:ubiquinone reductase (Na(+)-transporting) subunit A [Planctomycetes bacterium RBG_16_64_10]
MIHITKGLNIPVSGGPIQEISYGPEVRSVALVADDYVGLKPRMAVRTGERVRLGQLLWTDKRHPDLRFTAPGSGVVVAIHRGPKRRLLSVVIELAGDDRQPFGPLDVATLTGAEVRRQLTDSGLWTALRTRPYNKVPDPDTSPRSIFVTAIDTNPLAADPAVILAESGEDFVLGLHALTHLTDGTVFVCHKAGSDIPGAGVPRVKRVPFAGPHPAGLPGTHIHFLDSVSSQKTVWFISYQDVVAYGALFRTGQLRTDRVVALAGPSVRQPRLLRTRLGACLDDLVAGQLEPGEQRVVSGSLLAGRWAAPPENYLGRYHMLVSVLPEGRQRELLGWQRPGFDKFSITRAFASSWLGRTEQLTWNTSLQGSRRAMVPIGVYEKVMPLDILPTQLLRALIVGDTDEAQLLGCLELDEEDLGLCTFVCPGKYDYGPILRRNLSQIEQEG